MVIPCLRDFPYFAIVFILPVPLSTTTWCHSATANFDFPLYHWPSIVPSSVDCGGCYSTSLSDMITAICL